MYYYKKVNEARRTEKQMVAIGVDQSLSNSEMYEHTCLENIKKLYKSVGKCDEKQQCKTINEA